MPRQITNRRRNYDRGESRSGGRSFTAEAVSALIYILGGLIFLVGSVCFLPALERYSAAGAWLFILGSLLYLAVTAADVIENLVYYRRHRRQDNKGVLELSTSLVYVLGSVLFVVGSVCFLPSVELKVWGARFFLTGSVLFIIGACVNITQITHAGTLFTLQMLNAIAICFVVGSMLFAVASVPYLWDGVNAESRQHLFTYLGAEFIIGSLLFFAGGLVNFYRAYVVYRHHDQGRHRHRSDGRKSDRTGEHHAREAINAAHRKAH